MLGFSQLNCATRASSFCYSFDLVLPTRRRCDSQIAVLEVSISVPENVQLIHEACSLCVMEPTAAAWHIGTSSNGCTFIAVATLKYTPILIACSSYRLFPSFYVSFYPVYPRTYTALLPFLVGNTLACNVERVGNTCSSGPALPTELSPQPHTLWCSVLSWLCYSTTSSSRMRRFIIS